MVGDSGEMGEWISRKKMSNNTGKQYDMKAVKKPRRQNKEKNMEAASAFMTDLGDSNPKSRAETQDPGQRRGEGTETTTGTGTGGTEPAQEKEPQR